MIVYAILLENEKFFLYPSMKIDKDALILEVQLLEEFVTINKPICISESYYIWDIKGVDIYVKKYMMEMGIQNVRGGSYCEVELPEYKIKALENEFLITKEKYLHKSSMVESIINAYKDMSKGEKEAESLILEKRLNEYQDIKWNLAYYNKLGINRSLLTTLEWLLSYMNEETMIDTTEFRILNAKSASNNELRPAYNAAMLRLKQLSRGFSGRFPDYEFSPALHFQRPDIIFDRIFIHKRYLYDWEESIKTAKEVYSKFEFMYYKMINYIEELEFDLSTFPEDFNESATITIKYLSLPVAGNPGSPAHPLLPLG